MFTHTSESTTDNRSGAMNRFWRSQLTHKCFYSCDSCMIKRAAINAAQRNNELELVRNLIPKSENCEIVFTYSRPYRWIPFFGRYVFMIVSDRGHYDFFSVCRINVKNSIKLLLQRPSDTEESDAKQS